MWELKSTEINISVLKNFITLTHIWASRLYGWFTNFSQLLDEEVKCAVDLLVKITAIAVVALRYYISLHPWATGSINQTNRWFLLVLACGNGFVEVGFLTKVKNSLGLTTTLLLVTERMLKAWRRDEPSLTWLRQRLVRGQRRLLLPATESGLGGRRLMPRPWLGVHLSSAWVFSLLQLH